MTSSTASRNPCHERRGGRAAQQEVVRLLTLDPASYRQAWRGAFCPPPSCVRHHPGLPRRTQRASNLKGEHCFQAVQSAPRNHERHTILRPTTVLLLNRARSIRLRHVPGLEWLRRGHRDQLTIRSTRSPAGSNGPTATSNLESGRRRSRELPNPAHLHGIPWEAWVKFGVAAGTRAASTRTRGCRCPATPRRRWSGRPESNRRRPAWEFPFRHLTSCHLQSEFITCGHGLPFGSHALSLLLTGFGQHLGQQAPGAASHGWLPREPR
jgi:hypothetical protein